MQEIIPKEQTTRFSTHKLLYFTENGRCTQVHNLTLLLPQCLCLSSSPSPHTMLSPYQTICRPVTAKFKGHNYWGKGKHFSTLCRQYPQSSNISNSDLNCLSHSCNKSKAAGVVENYRILRGKFEAGAFCEV